MTTLSENSVSNVDGAQQRDWLCFTSSPGQDMEDKTFVGKKEGSLEKSMLLDLSQELASVGNPNELEASIRGILKYVESIQGYSISKLALGGKESQVYIENYALGENPMIWENRHPTDTKYPVDDGLQNRVLGSYIPLLFHIGNEIYRGTESPYLGIWKEKGFEYIIGYVLRQADQNLGILWLVSNDLNFSLITSLGAQISMTLANLLAREELALIKNQQEHLLGFTKQMAVIKEKSDLEKTMIELFRKLFDAHLAMVHILYGEGVELSPYMIDNSLPGFGNPNGKGNPLFDPKTMGPIIERILDSQKPVVFDLDAAPWKLFRYGKEFGLKKMLGAPLVLDNRPLGVLWLLVDYIDNSLLMGICAQISMALAPLLKEKTPSPAREKRVHTLDSTVPTVDPVLQIIGQSEPMARVKYLIDLVAPTESTVLISGETGTGKELIAKAIHWASPRSHGPLIKVNCAAIPFNLIESELFGHEKGAFTGAFEKRIGKFEMAQNGTLFLDEIGEMPLGAQVKLLRVLQERELERIGGHSTIKVNVRIIAATNRDLEKETKEGHFRSDLFYRLNVFPIQLPPLRERMEDLEPLINFLLLKYTRDRGRMEIKISPRAIQQLYAHTWPGNVRELEHFIERSVLMATDGSIKEIQINKLSPQDNILDGKYFDMTLEDMERSFILQILKRCRGKISGPGGAAEILGIPGNTLHSKMKKLTISRSVYTPGPNSTPYTLPVAKSATPI